MQLGRDRGFVSSLRLALAGLLAGFCLSSPVVAQGTLLPPGFFDDAPATGVGQAGVEADRLSYDAANDIISASGGVVMTYEGYIVRADSLVYNQRTGELEAKGPVAILDPSGSTFYAEDIEITGGLKEAFLRSLTIELADGGLITADEATYSRELEITLSNAAYSPCGECIDAKGRRIGWKVRTSHLVYDRESGSVELSDPVLELLGVPVAWVPWLRLPDPSQPRLSGFRLPELDYTAQMGATLSLPYFLAVDEDTDVIFSPRLMTRQGALFAAEVIRRFTPGEVRVKVSGLYQLDRSAFAGTVGDRDWRGALQTSGEFVPEKTWRVGWSYTIFTDAAFLTDYKLVTGKDLVNQAYAIHLSRDYYADLRVQQFNLLGNVTTTQQDQQARALPNIRAGNVTDLENGWGQVRTSLRVLGVQRGLDHTATYNGVPYVLGYAENKAHATLETSWQKQWIGPGGIVATPYLGLRGDAAWYDGSSPLLPGAVTLLTATPIAALDIRWPLISTSGDSSFLFEPIAQVVYRGSATTAPGITNDNAQSFSFDDANLFSYDRFSGTDRQETGARANIGAHYLANFSDGSWLDLIGGQSYFLGGTNALGITDRAQVGTSTGLGGTASYFVLGAKAGIGSQFQAGTKLQIDPAAPRVTLATLGASYADQGWSARADYTYIAADPAIGTIADQHEIATNVGVPVADYWTAQGILAWDIDRNSWLEAGAGLVYDDGYLVFGATGVFTGPTHTTPNDFRATATFRLRGPTGEFGFSR